MAYVSIATREYGEGRICIHTDNIDATNTGHTVNPLSFWRDLIEWVSGKQSYDVIKVAVINNRKDCCVNRINDLIPVSVDEISLSDIEVSGNDYDCLYFCGLPSVVSSSVGQKIRDLVADGTGMVIAIPDNPSENINVLSYIDSVYCYSDQKPTTKFSYWTNDGVNSSFYNDSVKISFMTTLRQSDFSSDWEIVMSDVFNEVTTTTTTPFEYSLNFNKSEASEFGISFRTSMQRGIVEITPAIESSESSSSSISSDSSGTSSSEKSEWDLCDNLVAQWTMNDNQNATVVLNKVTNNSALSGSLRSVCRTNVSSTVESFDFSDLYTSRNKASGVIDVDNGALALVKSRRYYGGTMGDSYRSNYIELIKSDQLNFSNQPFSVSVWVYCESPNYYPSESFYPVEELDYTYGDFSGDTTGKLKYIIVKGSSFAVHYELINGDTEMKIYLTNQDIIHSAQRQMYSEVPATEILDKWHHIVVTYGAVDENDFKMYWDGLYLSTKSGADTGSYSSINNVISKTLIGLNHNGRIDNLMVFDKEISEKEVEALYNRGDGTEDCMGDYWNTSSSLSSESSSSSIGSSSSSSSNSSSSSFGSSSSSSSFGVSESSSSSSSEGTSSSSSQYGYFELRNATYPLLVNGYYEEDGAYNSRMSYKHVDSEWYVYFDGYDWIVGTVKGGGASTIYFANDNPSPFDYFFFPYGGGGGIGTPIFYADTATSSSSSSSQSV